MNLENAHSRGKQHEQKPGDGSDHRITQKQLRTPRAAAMAGILFSLLLGTSIVLVYTSIPEAPLTDADWLTQNSNRVSIAITLVPFAGIAFLWFMGVIRDQIGALEDQFFSTVFLGSGLLFLGGIFVWMAVTAAVLASHAAAPGAWVNSNAHIFGRAMIQVLGGMVALRMAGVFMFSSGTIWSRTKVMPRWIIWLTFLTALVLLIGGGSLRWFRLAFPIWVLVISLLLLRAGGGDMILEDGDGEHVDADSAKQESAG